MYFGQAGLLALPGWVTAPVLENWIQEGRDFAAEWVELRPLHQNKLCGRCLRAPLQVGCPVLCQGQIRHLGSRLSLCCALQADKAGT